MKSRAPPRRKPGRDPPGSTGSPPAGRGRLNILRAMTTAPLEAATGARPATVLAHDYLLVLRGGERNFAEMADMFPCAPILTLLYDREATEDRFAGHEVIPSPLQRLG